MGHCMLSALGLLKDKSCFGGPQLEKVPKDKDRESAHDLIHHGDLSQTKVKIVEEVGRNHGDLVHNDAFEVSEEVPLLGSLLVRHGEEGVAELEPEKGVQSLTTNICRGSSSE